jgi:hypothetical protein
MANNNKNVPKTAKKTPKKVPKSAATTSATTSATQSATATTTTTTTTSPSKLAKATATMSKSGEPKLRERPVRSWRAKELLEIRREVLYARKSFAEQMMGMTSLVSKMRELYDSAVKSLQDEVLDIKRDFHMVDSVVEKLGGEVGDIKADFQMVDSAVKKLGDEIGKIEDQSKINVDKADSSEIFKELAWREERSRELILFRIDESESKSWNETKTYERTELTKTINKVCDFNESEVVFIRRVGIKIPNMVRPIVVGLKSKSRRDEIVAKGRKARIGIDENLTPKQLENKRNIKDEIKLKNEREGEGCYVYRMVGSAGNYKSIRVKKLDY